MSEAITQLRNGSDFRFFCQEEYLTGLTLPTRALFRHSREGGNPEESFTCVKQIFDTLNISRYFTIS